MLQTLPDVSWVDSVPAAQIATEIIRAAALQTALAARLANNAKTNGANGKTASDCLLTAEQMAKRLSVPKSKVLTMAREGRIPSVRIGKYVRFDAEKVEAALGAGAH